MRKWRPIAVHIYCTNASEIFRKNKVTIFIMKLHFVFRLLAN